MHILIVEDEPKVRDVLKAYMENEGWVVDYTPDGLDAVVKFDRAQHDLILLDLKLQGISGEEVCAKIREKSNVPIIMITSKSLENDTIKGLNLGADDYIVKPFRVKEVIARINALFRRTETIKKSGEEKPLYTYNKGDLVVNLNTRNVIVRGRAVNLTSTEFKLLSILIHNTKRLYSRSELVYLVQGYRFHGDGRSIDAHVKNLRKKIEEDSQNPIYIITKIGNGYQFGFPPDSESHG